MNRAGVIFIFFCCVSLMAVSGLYGKDPSAYIAAGLIMMFLLAGEK